MYVFSQIVLSVAPHRASLVGAGSSSSSSPRNLGRVSLIFLTGVILGLIYGGKLVAGLGVDGMGIITLIFVAENRPSDI